MTAPTTDRFSKVMGDLAGTGAPAPLAALPAGLDAGAFDEEARRLLAICETLPPCAPEPKWLAGAVTAINPLQSDENGRYRLPELPRRAREELVSDLGAETSRRYPHRDSADNRTLYNARHCGVLLACCPDLLTPDEARMLSLAWTVYFPGADIPGLPA